jgi:hypothetical protein
MPADRVRQLHDTNVVMDNIIHFMPQNRLLSNAATIRVTCHRREQRSHLHAEIPYRRGGRQILGPNQSHDSASQHHKNIIPPRQEEDAPHK